MSLLTAGNDVDQEQQVNWLQRLSALSSSNLSDALDRHGIVGAVEGLKPIVPNSRIVGRAVTLLYLPVGTTGGTAGDYLDIAGPGDVLVIDNRGRTDCTVWGGILSEASKNQNLAGTIIDGATRDVETTRDLGYPMWTRGVHMRTGKDRVMLQGINVPIALGHARVDPGDFIVADQNGVVVIPQSMVETVIASAEHIVQVEQAIVADVRAGVDLAEARRRHNYFGLQSKLP